jgi:hypothetical protein
LLAVQCKKLLHLKKACENWPAFKSGQCCAARYAKENC